MEKLHVLLEKVKETKIDRTKQNYTFKISRNYFLRSILFISIIIVLLIYSITHMERKNILTLSLLTGITIYICNYLYRISKYKIELKDKTLVFEKNIIDLTKVEKLSLKYTRIGGSKYDNCLELITQDKKRFVFRLNITNHYEFVALISDISKMEVSL